MGGILEVDLMPCMGWVGGGHLPFDYLNRYVSHTRSSVLVSCRTGQRGKRNDYNYGVPMYRSMTDEVIISRIKVIRVGSRHIIYKIQGHII